MPKLTEEQSDALRELINIGIGNAAGMLSEMIEFRIQLQIPDVEVVSPLELQNELKQRLGRDPLSSVKLGFSGCFTGGAQLVFPTESAATLVAVLTGEDVGNPDLDALKVSTLSEVGNIVINGVMGSIGNVLNRPLDYAVPSYSEEEVEHLLPSSKSEEEGAVLLAPARFSIEELHVQGDVIIFFDVGSFEVLLEAIAAILA